jgi:hypothetical protein
MRVDAGGELTEGGGRVVLVHAPDLSCKLIVHLTTDMPSGRADTATVARFACDFNSI